jgi:hypothetical protein
MKMLVEAVLQIEKPVLSMFYIIFCRIPLVAFENA